MKEQITSLREYKEIIKEAREGITSRIMNLALLTDEVQRYISLGRMYVLKYNTGIQILLDEESYYRCFFIWEEGASFGVEKQDKPLLVRLPYKHRTESATTTLDSMLEKSGFLLKDTSAQIVVDAGGDGTQYQKQFERMRNLIERGNFSVKYADVKDLEQIRALRDADQTFSRYHFTYKTETEWKHSIENGYIRCIYNENGQVVAAQQFDVDDVGIQGEWISVLDEYKNNYGFGMVLAYQSLVYANEKKKRFYGWVVSANERSVRYHMKLGYQFTGRYVKDWVLE